MAHRQRFPRVVATRLSDADNEKLRHLCTQTQQAPSEMIRMLIRAARPVDVVPIRFVVSRDHEYCHE